MKNKVIAFAIAALSVGMVLLAYQGNRGWPSMLLTVFALAFFLE